MATATLEMPVNSPSVPASAGTSLAATAESLQLISFTLGGETYGIEITKIREIIRMGQVTQVPETPSYIKGLINLRSMVIPVIDLRVRFRLAEGELTEESRIMVLNVGSRTIGIVVDAVSEVLRVSGDQICEAPPTVASLGKEYMMGLVRLQEQLLILLNVDNLFGQEDVVAGETVATRV